MREDGGELADDSHAFESAQSFACMTSLGAKFFLKGKRAFKLLRSAAHKLRDTYGMKHESNRKECGQCDPLSVFGKDALRSPFPQVGIRSDAKIPEKTVNAGEIRCRAPVKPFFSGRRHFQQRPRDEARSIGVNGARRCHGPGWIQIRRTRADLPWKVLAVDDAVASRLIGVSVFPFLQEAQPHVDDVGFSGQKLFKCVVNLPAAAEIRRGSEKCFRVET